MNLEEAVEEQANAARFGTLSDSYQRETILVRLQRETRKPAFEAIKGSLIPDTDGYILVWRGERLRLSVGTFDGVVIHGGDGIYLTNLTNGKALLTFLHKHESR